MFKWQQIDAPNKYKYRKKCAVINCPNVIFNEEFRYFSFPENPEMNQKWIDATGNPELVKYSKKQIRNRFCICSRHFQDYQFQNNLKLRLNRGQVPTINLPTKPETPVDVPEKNLSDPIPHFPILINGDVIKEETFYDEPEEPRLEIGELNAEEQNYKYIFSSVKVYTDKGTTEICRTCLKPSFNHMKLTDSDKKSQIFRNMLEFVLPDLNLDIYPDAKICNRCEALLSYSYEFKRKWLSTEETLHKYILKKTFTQRPVNIVILPDEHKNEVIGNQADETVISQDHNYAQIKNLEEPEQNDMNNDVLNFMENVFQNNCEETENKEKSTVEMELVQKGPFYKRKKRKLEEPPDGTNILNKEYDGYFETKGVSRLLRKRIRKFKKKDWGEAPYLCETCGRIFGDLTIYKRHLANHRIVKDRVDVFTCDICGLTLQNINIRQHYATHKPKEFTCDICQRQFGQFHLMMSHIKAKHETVREEYGQCYICGKKIKRSCMKLHLLIHDPNSKKVKCHICKKGFFYKCNLKRHLMAHQEANYKCHLCGKLLKHEHNLVKHIAIKHENRGDSYCEICDRTFWNRYKLKTHLINKHGQF